MRLEYNKGKSGCIWLTTHDCVWFEVVYVSLWPHICCFFWSVSVTGENVNTRFKQWSHKIKELNSRINPAMDRQLLCHCEIKLLIHQQTWSWMVYYYNIKGWSVRQSTRTLWPLTGEEKKIDYLYVMALTEFAWQQINKFFQKCMCG